MNEAATNWDMIEELWQQRHDPARLAEFAVILEQAGRQNSELAYPRLWRAARLAHFRAMQADEEAGPPSIVKGHYEAGAEQALRALQSDGTRVEGHFWHGVNLIEAARRQGWLAGARALPVAMRHIERAVAMDEEYHFGGPVRVWARLTHLRPLVLGGSLDRALDIYRRALQIAPHNSTNLLYYAEGLIADQQRPPAREALRQIIDADDDPAWRWEQARDRRLAAALLKSIELGK